MKGFLALGRAGRRSAVIITSRTRRGLARRRPPHRGRRAGRTRPPSTPGTAGPLPGGAAPRRARGRSGSCWNGWTGTRWHAADPAPPGHRRPGNAAGRPARHHPAARRMMTSGDRATSLAASIAYSFTHLPPSTRRLLPAVCLFHGVADANVLTLSLQAPVSRAGSPGPAARTGWRPWMTRPGWGCSPARRRHVPVHPALPTYLAARWRAEDPGGLRQRAGRRDPGPGRRLRWLRQVAEAADRIRQRRLRVHDHRAAAAYIRRHARLRPGSPARGSRRRHRPAAHQLLGRPRAR